MMHLLRNNRRGICMRRHLLVVLLPLSYVQVELWRSIHILELTGAQATLQIPPELAAQLHTTVNRCGHQPT